MRYLLGKELVKELDFRQEYIYDVFKLFTSVNYDCDDFIELISMPNNTLNILIIIGHDDSAERYLRYNGKRIQEDIIIIISCNARKLKKYVKNKEVYISLNEKDITFKRKGADYGFEFDVTESEINLFNAKGTITERIGMSFKKI